MQWDLYLDESGSFQYPGEHTLVGGVLIPQHSQSNDQLFVRWRKEFRERISETGHLVPQDLETGDEWHKLYSKKKRLEKQKQTLNETDARRFAELSAGKYYVFDHCSENSGVSCRWPVQEWVLRQYMAKLQGIGGQPVVFDNPDGVYHVDSNTIFMTIFANGLIRLYDDLQKQYPHEEIRLNVHAAIRSNITKQYEPKLYTTSPLAGQEDNLERKLYLNQIRNYIFLNGGYHLLQRSDFNDTLKSFEIISDINQKGVYVPNPATIICDYVCNSCYNSKNRNALKIALENAKLRNYFVFGPPLKLNLTEIEKIAEDKDWLAYLELLLSRQFPADETQDFFTRLAADKNYNQNKLIDGLVNNIYTYIDERINMQDWIQRLHLLIENCMALNPEAYGLLKANLLIYLNALYTHLGQDQDLQENIREFVYCISSIQTLEYRDELLVLFSNRQIVTCTDCFQFEEGYEWFGVLDRYFKKALARSEDLVTDFTLLTGGTDILPTISQQYGKAIGSTIQLLTKAFRNTTGEQRATIEQRIQDILPEALKQFVSPNDQSRAHQNLCDLKTELGQYDEAMDHLYQAIIKGTATEFKEQAEACIEKIGNYGEKNRSKFLYLHYVFLMHRCLRNGDPRGEILLETILKTELTQSIIDSLSDPSYPSNLVCWHLGASLALQGKQKNAPDSLLKAAMDSFAGQGEIFRTISMAVKAEQIALGLSGLQPGDVKSWEKEAKQFILNRYPEYAKTVIHNPFIELFEKGDVKPDIASMFRISDLVVY